MNQSDLGFIFFSYSWKDQAIAMRIFYDLTRSNISVWRDQANAEKSSFNFLSSIYEVIDKADFFLLIDSPNSRESFYVKKEIQYFFSLANKNPKKKLIICLVEEKNKTHQKRELFYEQNHYNFFDFTGIRIYDTYLKYNQSISELIKHLGGDFVPWTNLPEGKDFEDEISNYKISDENVKILKTDFENFIFRHKNEYPNLDTRLKIIIKDCERLNISSITPFLSLGILYAEEAKKEDNQVKQSKAKKIFSDATLKFPDDPRAWRGLGGTTYFLNEFNESLFAFNQAYNTTLKSQNKNHLKYLKVIKENKAEVLIELNQFEKALEIFSDLLKEAIYSYHVNPKHFIDLAFCYLKLSQFEESESTLQKGLKYFTDDATLLSELGKFYVEINDYSKAIFFYKKAIEYNRSQPTVIASLCYLIYLYGVGKDFIKYFKMLNEENPKTELGHYLYGQIYYFEGFINKAKFHYNKSKGKIGPYYDMV